MTRIDRAVRLVAPLLALTLGACVGVAWTDRDTGELETRVYTPADLLPDSEDDEPAQ